MNIPQSFVYSMPTRIVFGHGVINQVGDELIAMGCQKPMVVTDQGVSHMAFFGRLKDSLGNASLGYEVFDAVPRDPDLEDIDYLVTLTRDKGCDAVVAIGGGSVLCAGRGLAVTLPSGKSSKELVGIGKIKDRPLPVVAIPTIAGTGSEVSGIIVLSDREHGTIVTIASPFCFPSLATLDPDVLADLPPHLAAISGVDALAHGLEALMTTTPNIISEALAVHACATLFKNLRSAILTSDMTSKGQCMIASAIANMACGSSRLCLGHAMIIPLSARFSIPHGVAAGLVLPHVLQFNLPVVGKRLLPLILSMGYSPGADTECILRDVVSLLEDLDFFKDFEAPKIEERQIREMAEQVVNSPMARFNLRHVDIDQVEHIYKAAFLGAKEG